MIQLPPGFSASAFAGDLAALGAYLVGAWVVIVAGRVVMKALRS